MISLNPEKIITIGIIQVSSAELSAILITLIIAAFVYHYYNNAKLIPTRMQSVLEIPVSFFYDKSTSISSNNIRNQNYTALVLSLFLFIFIANQFTLIPLVQSVTVGGKQAFTTPTAHFSLTIALAIIVVFVSHYLAFSASPKKHLDNLINLGQVVGVRSIKQIPNALLAIFLGLLNLIGEISKVISLSARLFGNIFAGEVMVVIIASLSVFTSYLVPIPFLLISIFSGLIQAIVFAFLSFSFITDSAESAS